MFNEREAIREYLVWIREERRKLSDDYWKGIERLRELDSLEREIEKETELAINETKQEELTLIQAIEKASREYGVRIESENKANKVDAKDIELLKEKDDNNLVIKKRKNNDIQLIANEVATYLKERGIPTSTKEIHSYLESKGYKISNTTSTINRVIIYQPKIERISRGFYQYR